MIVGEIVSSRVTGHDGSPGPGPPPGTLVRGTAVIDTVIRS
jgi:hypothetical protein